MKYTTTSLEDIVKELYIRMGINDADYPIEDIAKKLDIDLHYFRKPSFSMRGIIFLSPSLSKEKQKEIFAHELAHVLYHVGVQIIMPELFRAKQEYQARNFALHFCIPTFMLQQIELPKSRQHAIAMVADTFGVTNEFADERLLHYEKQIIGAALQEEFLKCSETKTEYTSASHFNSIDM